MGVVIAAVSGTALAIFAIFFLCRRRRKTVDDSEKPIAQPRSLLARLRRRKDPAAHEASGDTNYPTEVGADATHERFELPAPLGPVELDSEDGTLDGTTENGASTQDSANISAYERARRKLERQRSAAAVQGQRTETYPIEKNDTDVSPVAHYRPPEVPNIESPLVSPIGPESGGSLTLSGVPSPVSPGFVSAPTSPITAPPPTYRRIDPSNVVYAGRLPGNVQLPRIPRMVGPDGRTIDTEPSDPSTLGSQYTANEGEDLYKSGDTQGPNAVSLPSEPSSESEPRTYNPSSLPSEPSEESEPRTRRELSMRDTHLQELLDPWGSRRRLDGEDLVHVPQPAENRFSWEEERTDGTD